MRWSWRIATIACISVQARSCESQAFLFAKLEMVILPMFYGRPKAYAAVMRSAIAINGSFFNTQRMVS